jgi:tetratricopeptide (TPR) repeat protein
MVSHKPTKSAILITVACLLFAIAGCKADPAKQKAAFLESGDKYKTAGQFNEAIIQYKNALKIDGNSAEINYKLAEAYFQNQQYRDCFLALKKTTDIDPNHAPALLLMGRFYLVTQQFQEALQSAATILQKNPDNIDAILLKANAQAGYKNLPEAVQTLEDLIAKHPDNVAAYLNVAIFYAAQGKVDLARKTFEKAVSVNPKSIGPRKALASFYLTTKEPAKAEEQYKAAVDANPDSVDANDALGTFYLSQNRLPEAEAQFKKIVTLSKNSAATRFNLASFYLGHDRLEEARKLDKEIIHDDPTFLLARLQAVEMDLFQGKLDDGDKGVNEILKDRPKEPRALMLQARLSLAHKNPQKAVEQLEVAQKLDPNVPALHYLQGVAYSQLGNSERAQSSFEQAIGLNAKYTEAYIALAEMMLSRGQNEAALQYAKQALEAAPGAADLYLLRGSAYANLKDLSNAEKDLGEFSRLKPNAPQGPMRLGYIKLMQKKYDEATKLFEKSIALDPAQTESYEGIAGVYRLQGKNDKAIELVSQQAAKANTSEMYVLLARLYMADKQLEKAEASLKKSLELNPNSYGTFFLLGTLYSQQKNIDKALAEYQAAIKINGNNASLWTVVGMLQQQANRPDEATKAYSRALEIEPNSGVAANNLAWMYATTKGGDLDKALDMARRAKVALPKEPTVSDTLGWVFYQRKLYDSAVPLLQEAIKANPSSAEYHYHLAASLLGSGKKDLARTELNAALRLDNKLIERSEVKDLAQQIKQ